MKLELWAQKVTCFVAHKNILFLGDHG
jgi:hypothetical protein